LLGGRGSILGLVIGAALIGVLQNGMVLMGVPAFWQQVVIGATIIVAVLLDRVRLRLVAAAAQAAAAPAGAAPGAVEGR
ncbi:MAG: hypothetical protein QN132_05645, partial [Armatimonadota bacterium]|nr:hypothetical protein [Armatimonadota bacterium]